MTTELHFCRPEEHAFGCIRVIDRGDSVLCVGSPSHTDSPVFDGMVFTYQQIKDRGWNLIVDETVKVQGHAVGEWIDPFRPAT